MIRAFNLHDVAWAVSQHITLMPNSVFSLFGTRFLTCFYRAFADAPDAVAFVYEDNHTPVAVIASASSRRRFLRHLLWRFWPILGTTALIGACRHRACRRLLGQTPRYLGRSRANEADAEMIFITVDPDGRRQGVARALIEATLDEFRRRRVRQVNVSIESDNAPVKALLNQLAFTVVDTFIFADKPNDLLTRSLEAAS